MFRPFALLSCFSLLAATAVSADVKPFLAKHCVSCHGTDAQKGDLRLDTLSTDFTRPEVREQWQAVLDRVTAGEMPPSRKPRPEAGEIAALEKWVSGEILTVERAKQKAEGRVVLRRLNRTEYENTIRDLLGVHVDVKELLPEDALSHGFDNIGEALNLSAVHLQRYLDAAELALDTAVARGDKPESKTAKYTYTQGRAANNIGKHWLKRPDDTVVFFSSGTFPSTQLDAFRAGEPGTYRIRITGSGYQSKEAVPFALYLGNFGRGGGTWLGGYHELPAGKPGVVEVTAHLDRGDSLQILPFGLKGFRPFGANPMKPEEYTGAGLAIQSVEVTGPVIETWPPRGHTLLFGDLPLKPVADTTPPKGRKGKQGPVLVPVSTNPQADAERLLPQFLRAAFRRPVTNAQATPYLALFSQEMKDGASFDQAMRTAASAALCSPNFLFLLESPGKLDDYALAARLSYFLWRTTPDDELLKLADAGKLGNEDVLRRQTERLLKHPNARRFVADFTDAWLDLRNIDFTVPDKLLYPEFDGMLQDTMLRETRAFFAEVVAANLPASTFVQSDFTFANERLARHYGLPGVDGVEVRKVPLKPEHHRGGVLTHASVLKVSANGTNTSPVVRGVYVLERFLGVTPQPPPPGVPAVEPDIRGAKTVRELLDKHRSVETCAGCHQKIDPPGFALESFDVIGGWRETFRSLPEKPQGQLLVNGERVRYRPGLAVDASGRFPDGREFAGFEEFRKHLLADPDVFAKCVTEKLLAFATGREAGFADRPDVAKLVKESAGRGHAFRDLIHAVVQSDLFRNK